MKRLLILVTAICTVQFVSCGPATAGGSDVTAGRASHTTRNIVANDFRPPECSMSITQVITGSGSFSGTSGADLLLGGAGTDSISGLGGTDCILAGDGDDTLNGGNGTDACLGGRGVNTFVSCETRS